MEQMPLYSREEKYADERVKKLEMAFSRQIDCFFSLKKEKKGKKMPLRT